MIKRWTSRIVWMLAGMGLAGLLLWSARVTLAQPPVPHAVGVGDDCLSCHQAGAANAPRVSWDHLGRGNDDCLHCHDLVGTMAASIPHTLVGRDDCFSCHREGVGASPMLSASHVDYDNEQCSECHPLSPLAEVEAIPIPEPEPESEETTHTALSDNPCVSCHQLVFADDAHALFTGQPVGDAEAGAAMFAQTCATCHGEDGDTPVGENDAVVNVSTYWGEHDDATILQDVGLGAHGQMAAFAQDHGGPLSWDEILNLVAFVRGWGPMTPPPGILAFGPSFSAGVLPVFQQECISCHSSDSPLGEWDGSSYTGVMGTGRHAPTVIPGDPDNSLLIQKMLDTQPTGLPMPPSQLLPQEQVQAVIDWIQAGAPNN